MKRIFKKRWKREDKTIIKDLKFLTVAPPWELPYRSVEPLFEYIAQAAHGTVLETDCRYRVQLVEELVKRGHEVGKKIGRKRKEKI